MSPKLVFSKDKIIASAFELARSKGIDAVSARSIAKEIKSSVAPIYSSFSSTDELKNAVLKMGNNLLVEYSSKEYTDKIFLNMGVGFVRFARDEQNLYRALFLEEHNFNDISNDFFEFIRYRMSLDRDFENMPEEPKSNLFKDMWTYVTGLATMMCSGTIKETNDKYIIQNLARVGAAIITSYVGKFDDPKDVKVNV